ncbi:MAG: biopolymer transporter ExbD [Brevinematales bacterium]|jgi:biopolymer transport protein ExbD
MLKKRTERKKLMTEINITPFTDVVLVLLIIFIIATPLIYQGKIKINLPETKSTKTEDKPMRMTVQVSQEGSVYIDNIEYKIPEDTEKIKEKILNTVGNSEDSAVVINGDKDCKYSTIIGIIDAIKEIGIKKILLGTEIKR